MIAFFDTETTGKFNFNAPPGDECQPHMVQVALILTDDNGNELSSLSAIVKPNGWQIPEAATTIHGISTKMATECGVDIGDMLPVLAELFRKPRTVVAHNIAFDLAILRGEFVRSDIEDPFEGASSFCTMEAMTPHCKLPGAYGDYKWPKLIEAYRHAFGKDFDGAHNALADVRACMEVYFWLKEQKP